MVDRFREPSIYGDVDEGWFPLQAYTLRHRKRHGFVLVTMTLVIVGVFGCTGLAIDIGRIFIAKNEAQAYCDAAALAAAGALDGTTNGIALAQAAVANSANTWNFGTATFKNTSVTFAKLAAGPWVSSPSPASEALYVRVTATTPVALYFLPLVSKQTALSFVSTAAAGQIPITSLSRGIAPYTVVSTITTGPKFGLVVGQSYDLQWPQYNGTRAHCGPASPEKCFNSPPCSGESQASLAAVVSNWGSSLNGYWGDTSNSLIAKQILDLVQLAPVAVGTNILPYLTNGNKASEAGYLDQRASQDNDTTHSTVNTYLSSSIHNGRRLTPVIVVNPENTSHTTVTGYGQFLLSANGSPSDYYAKTTNGNDPFCATYAGPYNIGSLSPGAGGTTGASIVRLIE
jgi:Flp pilus assembly protein TadG